MRRVIFKVFEFHPDLRNEYAFSDTAKIGVAGYQGTITLKPDSHCHHPTDDDIWFKTDLYNPQALTEWLAIQPWISHPKDEDGVVHTEIKFKLSNGTDDYYWDGAWSVAGASDWMTITDLQANFATFTAVSSKKLALIANLKTDDLLYTPVLGRILVALEVDIGSWVEEYLYNTLIPELEAHMSACLDMDWAFDWGGGTTMDLSEYVTESGYIFENWREVYDYAGDPDHENDLLDNYNQGTGILTLSAPVDEGTRLFARVVPDVEYAVSTDADYYTASRLPAVVFRHYQKFFAGWSPAKEAVINYDTAEALVQEGPRRNDLDMPVDILTDRALPQPRMLEMFQHFSETKPIIVSKGVGAKVRLEITEDAAFYARSDEEGMLRGVLRIRLHNCQEWYFASTTGHAIKQLVADGAPMPTDC